MSATRLHLAAFDGDNETANQLLVDGMDADAQTTLGETPLYLAPTNGHTIAERRKQIEAEIAEKAS